ncbi:MAG: radical SAM protein [Candidatus Omnitrophota bacterium]
MVKDEFREKMNKKNIPLRQHIYLTWKCNLRCIHCYNYLPKDHDLTTSEVKNRLDQLAARGCLFLCFSGGEPLIRDDFVSIAEYAVSRDFILAFDTNAILITPDLAAEIKRLRFSLVKVTLFGATAATHDKITQTPGSFEQTLNGINALKQKKINLMLLTTMMGENINQLGKIKSLAEDWGIKYRFSPLRPFTQKEVVSQVL